VKFRSQMTLAQVPSIKVSDLRAGVQVSSLQNAHSYINLLEQSVCAQENPPSYCPQPPPTSPPADTPATTVALPALTRPDARAGGSD
jgi:hypothetical protein